MKKFLLAALLLASPAAAQQIAPDVIDGCVYSSVLPTLTTGQHAQVQCDSSGHLLISGSLSVGGTAQGAASAGVQGTMSMGISTTAPPSYTTAQVNALSLDTSGNLRVSATGTVGVSNQPVGAAAFATAQAAPGVSATSIVAARTGAAGTGRIAAIIINMSTTPVYLGGSGVTTATGQYLAGVVGAAIVIPTTAAIYGIVTSGTGSVSVQELY